MVRDPQTDLASQERVILPDTKRRVGGQFMTLILTAELNGANPFDYLTQQQRHAEEVAGAPANWSPWKSDLLFHRLSVRPICFIKVLKRGFSRMLSRSGATLQYNTKTDLFSNSISTPSIAFASSPINA